MTYYKQFAEMLGLELEQEFILTTSYAEKANLTTYKITEDGIRYKSATRDYWFVTSSEYLDILLSGEFKAVPKPWKPKKDEQYWYYSIAWESALGLEFNSSIGDLLNWKVGNCFKTKEEALVKGKEIMEQIMKEYKEA